MAVAHADVTLDVEGRAASKSESFHVSENLSLVESSVSPRPTETTDELLVNRTAVVVDQLDLLTGSVMSVAVTDDQIESICKCMSM